MKAALFAQEPSQTGAPTPEARVGGFGGDTPSMDVSLALSKILDRSWNFLKEPRVPLVGSYTEGEWVPLERVVPNPIPPRSHYAEEIVQRFAASIERLGLLYPLLVYRSPAGGGEAYVLVDGHYRYHALKLLAEKSPFGEALLVPVRLANGLGAGGVRMVAGMAEASLHVPHTALDRVLLLASLASLSNISLEEMAETLAEIHKATAKKDNAFLVAHAVTLKALGVMGLRPSLAAHYFQVFVQEPRLFDLVRKGAVSERVFRLLASPRVRGHPQYQSFLSEVEGGIHDEESFLRRIKDIVEPSTPERMEQVAYRSLKRALRRLNGDWERLRFLVEQLALELSPKGGEQVV